MKKTMIFLFMISIAIYGEKDHSISYYLDGEDQLTIKVVAWEHMDARNKARKMMGLLLSNNGMLSEDGWKKNISPRVVEEHVVSVPYDDDRCYYKYTLVVALSNKEHKSHTFWYCLATLLFSGLFHLAIS